MLKWPAQPDSLYTVVMSNLDINSRRNRLEQCNHNGGNILMIDIFSLQNIIRVLALVCGQHSRRLGGWRRGYLWASLPACFAWRWRRPQIRILCVRAAWPAGLQGGGRPHRLLLPANVKRPRTFQVGVTCHRDHHLDVRVSRSTKNFMKKYNLELTAATFLILDSNEASMEVSCVRPGQATGVNLFTSRLPASGRNVSGTPSTWSVRSSVDSRGAERSKLCSAICNLKCQWDCIFIVKHEEWVVGFVEKMPILWHHWLNYCRCFIVI